MGINAWFTDSRISFMAIMIVVLQLGFKLNAGQMMGVYRVQFDLVMGPLTHQKTRKAGLSFVLVFQVFVLTAISGRVPKWLCR